MSAEDSPNSTKPLTMADFGHFTENVLIPAIGKVFVDRVGRLEERIVGLEVVVDKRMGRLEEKIDKQSEKVDEHFETLKGVLSRRHEDVDQLREQMSTIKSRVEKLEVV